MTILVTGLDSAGKTTFCRKLVNRLFCSYFNADDLRRQTKNNDFSMRGRKLAAENMKRAVNCSAQTIKIVDMICPTPELRQTIQPDVIVFISSPNLPKYPDTASLYAPPTESECQKLFVAKFNRHSETIDELVFWLEENLEKNWNV